MRLLLLAITLVVNLVGLCAKAQPPHTDTINITLTDAENRFLKNNLQLLSNKYHVEAARAMILQAKLWANPNLSYQQSIYNDQTKKWFPTSVADGQFNVGISQLINIAGQRNKRIKLEKINTEITEYNFFDLMRTLKYQLHSDYFTLAYDIRSLKVYDLQISSLKQMTDAYSEQLKKGNVAEKEVIRLKALLLTLLTERKELSTEIITAMSDLRTLMADTTGSYFVPQIDAMNTDTLSIEKFTLAQLTEAAQANRYDLKAGEAGVRHDAQDIKLQRSLGVPDLTAGVDYERNSSFPNNYYGLQLNMDLPVVNRNQGNIKAAKFNLKAAELDYQKTRLDVDEDVITAYAKALEADRLYKSQDKNFSGQYEKLMGGIKEMYQKHNLSLVEFIDYYQAYKENIVQWNKIQADRMNAIEQLNFATGTNNFNY